MAIFDCEMRIWDLTGVDFDDPGIRLFWDKMLQHGRILTGEQAPFERKVTVDDLIGVMDRNGIQKACLTVPTFKILAGQQDTAEVLHDAVRKYPSRIVGYPFVNPLEGRAAVDRLERCVKELNLRDICVYPPDGWYLDDREIAYPFLQKCTDLGIRAVFVHTGLLSMPQLSLKYAHPIHLDEAARDFPELTFVAEHLGYPWETDLIAVAWKNKNVYMCGTYLSAMLPRAPLAYLHPLGRAMRDVGDSRRILWGSDWAFWTEGSLAAEIEAIRNLVMPEELQKMYGYPEITQEDRDNILWKNAERLFG